MDSAKENFKIVVKRLFNNWSGLHLAVEHGMGGRNGQKVCYSFTLY